MNQLGYEDWDEDDYYLYHSGLDDSARQQIRQRLRDGQIPVLFTSVKAVTTSLQKAIIKLAERGRLQQLVIDEAHLMLDWSGADFMGDYKALPGLRNHLLNKSKNDFRTVLLSGTLTQEHVDALSDMFAYQGARPTVINEPLLRPEPRYWQHQAAHKDEQLDCLYKALQALPRPLIIYTTAPKSGGKHKVLSAVDVHRNLKALGYQRLAMVHGDTSPKDRAEVLKDLGAPQTRHRCGNQCLWIGRRPAQHPGGDPSVSPRINYAILSRGRTQWKRRKRFGIGTHLDRKRP